MISVPSPSDKEPSGLRTGEQYLAQIRHDGRQVVYDGEIVADVTSHPAFRGAARTIAELWDLAADPANRERMTYKSPKTGRPVLRCYHIPREPADLGPRRRMLQRWTEHTFGLMGRTPDHVAGFFSGFAANPTFFAATGQDYADNLVAFYEHARDNHLYMSYAIVPPQIDRSKPSHKQSDPTLCAGVVAERDGGIVLKGAQQLATGAVFRTSCALVASTRSCRAMKIMRSVSLSRSMLQVSASTHGDLTPPRRPHRSTIRCPAASTKLMLSSHSMTFSCHGIVFSYIAI